MFVAPLIAFAATPSSSQTQGPIRVLFDLPCDPFPEDAPFDIKHDAYIQKIGNINRVLDQTEPLGVRVSFLSAGEWMEFVVLEGPEEDYYVWYNHDIWNPFRPSTDNYMAEDLDAPFVQITQGAVIGNAALHHNTYQHMTAPGA